MRRISILCGNGGLFLDFEMERGADGANTGYCFPDMLCDVVRLSAGGRREEAHDLFDAHLPLLRYEQQPGVGLAVRKYVLKRRGILASAAQRQPATSMSADRRGPRSTTCSRASPAAIPARGSPDSLSPRAPSPKRTFVRRMPAAPDSAHSGVPAKRLARKSTNTRTLADRWRRLGIRGVDVRRRRACNPAASARAGRRGSPGRR